MINELSLTMHPLELDLEIFLSRYAGYSVDFFRFPGNYGDSLIWHGTKKLLSSLKIAMQYVDLASKSASDILIIDGGGNLTDLYSDVANFLSQKAYQYDQIIILPHTITGTKSLQVLSRIASSRLTVFCREVVTASKLKQHLRKCQIYLWHDCALYNNYFCGNVPRYETLNAFRRDKESIRSSVPVNNCDLSLNGYATKPLRDLVNTVGDYYLINTDRLHIAMCGLLHNRQVRLYPNSYYKNEAVYNYSLRRFTNIIFVPKWRSRN